MNGGSMFPRRLSLIASVLLGVLLLTPAAAYAHAELVRSDPKPGAVLTKAPDRVTLAFSEAVSVEQSSVRLGSHRLTIARAQGRPKVLVADTGPVRASLAGSVTLAWQAVSADDGHLVTGSLRFRVRGVTRSPSVSPSPAVLPDQAASPDHPIVKDALSASRLLGYLGLAVFVGGLLFLAILWPQGAADRRTARLLTGAWITGTATTVAGIGLQGAYVGRLPLSAAARPSVFGQVLATHVGEVWAAKCLLWVLAAVVLAWALQARVPAVTSAPWRVAALAVGAGLLRTAGMTGHAAETAHPGWDQLADFLHLAGMSSWFGGLVVLLVGVLRRRRADELAHVVPRYSGYALASVTLMVASGVFMAWQLVGSVTAVFTTSYGRLLLIKLVVLAVVLLAAQRSKTWVAARLDLAVLLRGDAATVRPFLYSVAAETVLLLGVLFAATLLVTAAPGR
jgi:copper transport protein